MDRLVYIYWDNSNIFIAAQYVAEEREGSEAKFQMRINIQNLKKLATVNRPLQRAIAVGSIPPEMKAVWSEIRGREGGSL